MRLRPSEDTDVPAMLAIVNQAAQAYRDVPGAPGLRRAQHPENGRRDEAAAPRRRADRQADPERHLGHATWAIDFYQRNGFTWCTYWSIPDRQIETSVVLADRRWVKAQDP